jgi:hypothetical protein
MSLQDYHFEGLKGITFWSVVVGRPRWLNMEDVRICVPCHFFHVDGHIDLSLAIVPTILHCMLCGQATKVAIMLICDQSSKG